MPRNIRTVVLADDCNDIHSRMACDANIWEWISSTCNAVGLSVIGESTSMTSFRVLIDGGVARFHKSTLDDENSSSRESAKVPV